MRGIWRICCRWFYCHTHRFSKMDKRRFALPKGITIKVRLEKYKLGVRRSRASLPL
jgi:hypothetical protein